MLGGAVSWAEAESPTDLSSQGFGLFEVPVDDIPVLGKKRSLKLAAHCRECRWMVPVSKRDATYLRGARSC